MKRFLFSILLFSGLGSAFAQDPTFSQSYNTPLYLNPALTGANGANNGLRLICNDMRQWSRIPGNFNTVAMSVDQGCTYYGLGITALHDERGEGFLTTNQFGFTSSFFIPIIPRKLDLSFGLGGNVVQKSLDWSKLEFSDQFDPVLGKISNTNQQQQKTGIAYPDFNTGVSIKWLADIKPGYTALYNLGFAWHHIFRPREGFNFATARIPSLFTAHFGSTIPMGDNWTEKGEYLLPYLVYNWQPDIIDTLNYRQHELVAGFYIFKSSFLFGTHYRMGFDKEIKMRNTDQFGLSIGFEVSSKTIPNPFKVTYSYVFPVDGVSYSTMGTHEISLLIMLRGINWICNGSGGPPSANKCFNMKRAGYIPQL